jgi:hypothetical protein
MKKSRSCIVIAISCKRDTYTMECTHYIYGCGKLCFDLCANSTLIAYDNYITTTINVTLNQQLLYNTIKCMALTHTIMPHVSISTTH